MEKRKSFVVYDSFLDMIEIVPDKEDKLQLALAMLRYGLGREDMELENPYLNAMFTGIKANIDAAQNRYDRACSGGVKGGRPTSISQDEVQELKSVGKTQKQVAQMLGVSERTVKRYWNIVSDDEGCQKVTKGERCHNLNDNDNDNVNDNENENNNKLTPSSENKAYRILDDGTYIEVKDTPSIKVSSYYIDDDNCSADDDIEDYDLPF